jgi:hypothetical protein
MERAADEVQRRSWASAPADPIARTDDTAGEQPRGCLSDSLCNGLGEPRGGRSATVFGWLKTGYCKSART